MTERFRIVLAGHKAHAATVFLAIVEDPQFEIAAVFSNDEDTFCLLGEKNIRSLAHSKGIPVYSDTELTRRTLEKLSTPQAIDILLLAEWRELIAQDVYSVPKFGAYNIHDGLLPEYRGSSCMNWAIINGEVETGATFYKLTSAADRGPIYAQIRVPILPNDYATDVLKRIVPAYAEVARIGLNAVFEGASPRIQDESRATYCAKRLEQDGLLDFRKDLQCVYNTIRALSDPFPGAFTFYEGRRIILRSASIVRQRYRYVGNIPGYIVRAKNVWILCGSGLLQIDEVELEDGQIIREPKDFFGDRPGRLLPR